MRDFQIITAATAVALVTQVKTLLAQGWLPFGPPISFGANLIIAMYQPV